MLPLLICLLLPGIALSDEVCHRFSSSNRPSLECNSASLLTLPEVPAEVVAVSLYNNSIEAIDSFPASYQEIQELDLRYNTLARIEPTAFEKLHVLSKLDLSHNSISTFVIQKGLQNLTWLSLAHNGLRFVPDFSALKSLRFLDLSFNALYRVNPKALPFRLHSLSFAHNRLSVLQPWMHLKSLQVIDVSANPLQCDCALWEWIAWADKYSLVDPSSLPCNESLAKMRLYATQKQFCGPIVEEEHEISRIELARDESTVLCCTISALPVAAVHWVHKGLVLGQGSTAATAGARMRHCIDIRREDDDILGEYRCVAAAGGRNSSKAFIIESPGRTLPPKPPNSLLFYAQFSLVLFLFVFCFASYCIVRRDKARRKKDSLCHRGHVEPILVEETYEQPSRLLKNYALSSEWTTDNWEQPQVLASGRCQSPELAESDAAPLAKFDPDSRSIAYSQTAI